jgi:hypothetical protein
VIKGWPYIDYPRAQQEMEYLNGDSVDPIVIDELHALREHKMDLEDKLNGLQDSRRHLMGQLEGLMRLLKVRNLLTQRNAKHVVERFLQM